MGLGRAVAEVRFQGALAKRAGGERQAFLLSREPLHRMWQDVTRQRSVVEPDRWHNEGITTVMPSACPHTHLGSLVVKIQIGATKESLTKNLL